jgi:hypothetical protein
MIVIVAQKSLKPDRQEWLFLQHDRHTLSKHSNKIPAHPNSGHPRPKSLVTVTGKNFGFS